jgi:hypothetical protein
MEGEDGLKDARDVFERAITSVGLHLTEVCCKHHQICFDNLYYSGLEYISLPGSKIQK